MSREALPPKRPSLPVTLPVLGALLGAETLVLRGVVPAPSLPLGAVLALCALALVALVVAPGHPPVRLACVVACGALAGVVASSFALWELGRFGEAIATSPMSEWSFEVESDPSLGTYGYRCRAKVMREGAPSGHVWLSLSANEEPRLGETLTCVGRFKADGDDEWGHANRAQGITGTVKVVRVLGREPACGPRGLVLRVRQRAIETFAPHDSGSGALLAASVCGYRGGMDELGLGDLFSTCGVSHLVAVSGGHIAVVSGILSVLLEGWGLGPRVRSVLLAVASGAFVAFCGAPVSALRSWLMTLVAFGALLLGRRDHALSSVCLVGIVIALVDPFSSGQLGFVLSVASVAALCVFSSYASYALGEVLRLPYLHGRLAAANRPLSRTLRSLRDTLAATLVAQAATMPVTIPTFGELSLVAPVANVLLGPPFTLLIGAGMLASVLGLLPLGGSVLALLPMLVAKAGANVALAALVPLSRLPFACVPTSGWVVPAACIALLVGVYAIWPRVRRRAVGVSLGLVGACLAVVLVRWRYLAPARIVVLDVGQGDAILVQDGVACLLVDTGPDASVSQALVREHVLHLDAIVLTHLHDDHTGGVDDLVGSVPCERVYVGEGVSRGESSELRTAINDLTGGTSEELSYGDGIQVGGFVLRVVSPQGSSMGDENGDSLELVVSYEKNGRSLSALLTGDAEEDETGQALARGDVGDVDFLKVGHHGSAVSLTTEEARELRPEVAVASAGEGNRYGHPTEECVSILEDAGAVFLCTKDVGDVEVRPGRAGPVVRYDGSHR